MASNKNEVQWGGAAGGGITSIKNPKFPSYSILGNARMADGKDVVIMTLQSWDKYCYDFNELNGIESPPALLANIQRYQKEELLRQKKIQEQ